MEIAMTLTIYGSTVSPFVRKVRVVMAEKGLQYSIDPVSPFRAPPDFRDISPLGRIPAFRDTDLPEPNHLSDSSVICDYVEHKYPAPAHCRSRNMRIRSWRRPRAVASSSSGW